MKEQTRRTPEMEEMLKWCGKEHVSGKRWDLGLKWSKSRFKYPLLFLTSITSPPPPPSTISCSPPPPPPPPLVVVHHRPPVVNHQITAANPLRHSHFAIVFLIQFQTLWYYATAAMVLAENFRLRRDDPPVLRHSRDDPRKNFRLRHVTVHLRRKSRFRL
ncbi:hypothetical protein E3N88_06060 [Mikania micrantha]|uniref:Uncharacterized protein n=1 Tax=Mikania micrantha TaxID=192012 RepID=A0A5N6PMP2_9ASTR|nr:hypothetical protein E3N88_06060 [Mikania micrantha]